MDHKARPYDTPHPYKITSLEYVYVFTVIDESTVIEDGFSLHKAVALADFSETNCDKGYQVCTNNLLKEDRKMIIWSRDDKVMRTEFVMKKGDEFEPHKHPRCYKEKIEKGEEFEWYTYTKYVIELPTKEKIDSVREKHGWYSKKSFYGNFHDAKELDYDALTIYAPEWMAEYEYSQSYLGFDFDQPVDERKLKKEGLFLERSREFGKDPMDDLERLIPNFPFSVEYWEENYFKSKVTYCAKKLTSLSKSAVITVGFLMPKEEEWVF